MKRTLAIVILCLVIAGGAIGYQCAMRCQAEPEFCALCHPAPYHAPCLVNITTGEVTELMIYEPHAVKVGELAASQRGGYMRMSMSGGLFVNSSPDSQEAHTIASIEMARANNSEFCKDCRNILSSASTTYVLADLFDADNIVIYDIVDGLCCEMRCYEVRAEKTNDPTKMHITNAGFLLDDK